MGKEKLMLETKRRGGGGWRLGGGEGERRVRRGVKAGWEGLLTLAFKRPVFRSR